MSEGTAVIYQVGDRVKFELGDCIDYGTVVEVDNSVYTTDGNVWALWDSTNIKQYSKPKYLTLIERKQTPKPIMKYPPHKYSTLLKHWLDGGEIQYRVINTEHNWTDYTHRYPPYICDDEYSNPREWRIKPEVKTLRYRAGLTKDNQIKIYTEQPMLDDAYGPDAFVKWIDNEWKTFSVEIE